VNYWIELHGNWSDALSPYWSLAVEEQFYLLWPFCMLLLEKRFRAYFLWFTVCFGIVFRYFSVHVDGGQGVSMFSCVDTFAWGALLAHYLRAGHSAVVGLWIKRLIIPVGFSFLMLCLKHTDADLIRQLLFRTFTSMVSVAVIFYAMKPGLWARILSVQPLRMIGQMSYGLYLYHMVVPDLFFQLAGRMGISIPEWPFNIVPFGVLSLSAYLSYRLIELPIQAFKRYFVA
jgi:peptidoglycan/LPS O-acetylase OafA/YrhL